MVHYLCYDEVLVIKDGETTCNLKPITPQYVSLSAMWLLFLQVNWKCHETFADCIHVLHERQEILSRKDGIKLHSLLHYQLRHQYFETRYAMRDALQNWQIIGHFLSFTDVCFPVFMDAYCQFQGARVGAFGCDTAIQLGRSRLRFPVT
jgi:hypothetical protein